ncbi:toll/interleukin-1 receptor domain-containing protein [Brevibacterium sediminis]|uniref:toll/interleukin-1 receptor domain-containing protein n=1 Tax=Brevibacterium sediminis TaxID=1857024 RepID=UPI00366F930A
MTHLVVDLPPVKIFFSYVRADDKSFSIVAPLKENLKQLIKALSGRPADIFIDRDDIGLGEDWGNAITTAVQQAYFFIPIYTGSYPQSDACREEFLKFRETAAQRNADKLIIPIVWFGVDTLLPEGEDDISDYIRAHQAASFEQAWIQGIDSAPYKENVLKIARRILEVAPEIDSALARAEQLEAGSLGAARDAAVGAPEYRPSGDALNSDDLEDEEGGIIELSQNFEAEIAVVTESANTLGEALSNFSNVPEPPSDNNSSANTISKYLIRVASAMQEPAQTIEKQGQRLFYATQNSDSLLRRIIRLTENSESPEMISTLHASLATGVASLSETQEVAGQLDELLGSMKTPEALSASVRRAIKPARQGIVAVQDAVRLIGEWPDLVASLSSRP